MILSVEQDSLEFFGVDFFIEALASSSDLKKKGQKCSGVSLYAI